MPTANRSDYFINVQTLYLSFLTRDEARELIEHPTPEFALGYESGVVDQVLDLTHGQPYLVQAIGVAHRRAESERAIPPASES